MSLHCDIILVAFLLFLFLEGTAGDMALRIASHQKETAAVVGQMSGTAPQIAPSGSRVVVKLKRVVAQSLRGGPENEAVFYVGDILVGHPQAQEFSVLFDTSAGNVVLPSMQCHSIACANKRRYSRQSSTSATRINADGQPVRKGDKFMDSMNIEFAQVDLGQGELDGVMVHDSVCVGSKGSSQTCTELGIVTASEMAEVPFHAMPHDGMVGLGLDALTVDSPLFNFLRRFSSDSGLVPQFSISLRGPVGELTFGGPGPSYPHASPTKWVPVARPTEGYWQVRIEAIRVENRTIHSCVGGCDGIVDTGASSLGVPAVLASKLGMALATAPVAGEGCQGPELHFELVGGIVLTLQPEDYAGPACGAPRLVPLQFEPAEQYASVFILGESLLRRYDTVFDWGSQHIGFSLVMPRAVRLGPPTGLDTDSKQALHEQVDFITV